MKNLPSWSAHLTSSLFSLLLLMEITAGMMNACQWLPASSGWSSFSYWGLKGSSGPTPVSSLTSFVLPRCPIPFNALMMLNLLVFSKQTKWFHACDFHLFFPGKPPPQPSWQICSLPSKAIGLHVLVCLSPPAESPRQPNLTVPLCYFIMSHLLLAHWILASTFYASESALTKTQNDLSFSKSKAPFLELSLFDTTSVFDAVGCVLVLEFSLYFWGVGPPHCPDFPPPLWPVLGLIFCLLSLHS